ncbi:MAG: hypothetical protein JWL60_2645 [Gemmatimonadetes bacterium]|nr:hypothetical protein [Gemmatimonadota bacterium]
MPTRESDRARSRDDDEAQGEQQAREAQSLDARTTYEVIRREGERELERTSGALFWSGLAAGLSMGFSFLGVAVLHAHLPEAGWRELVTNLGYSVGFLIVILGSQQLFTENTLMPVIPLLARPTRARLRTVLRLWAVVLLANILGALLFALAISQLDVVEPKVQRALSDVAARALEHDFARTLLRGVYAGWLIALMVWMLPAAGTAKPALIVVMTWLVGVAGFSHVVAGAAEAFHAAIGGEATWTKALAGFILPALLGNVAGGLTMVAALNHAQATTGEGVNERG